VVDDGSTDGTAAVLSSIRDPRLRVIRTENMGVCHARNRALEEVGAPYVAVMDADDLCHSDRLARQVRQLNEHPELVGVGSSVWLMTPRGRRIYEDQCPTGTKSVLFELHQNGGGIYPQTCVMRTDLVRTVGGYRPAIPVSEDLDLLLRLSTFGGLDNIGEPLYSYRLNARGLTFSSKARRDYYAEVALKLWAERKETGSDSLDRGELVAPFVPAADENAKSSYTLRKVFGYFHRKKAMDFAARGQRMRAMGQILMSLAYSPGEINGWRSLRGCLLGRALEEAC
jgi:glycosyltransferase involved in cell wall biosynthesis